MSVQRHARGALFQVSLARHRTSSTCSPQPYGECSRRLFAVLVAFKPLSRPALNEQTPLVLLR
jgi:hypothetical protein